MCCFEMGGRTRSPKASWESFSPSRTCLNRSPNVTLMWPSLATHVAQSSYNVAASGDFACGTGESVPSSGSFWPDALLMRVKQLREDRRVSLEACAAEFGWKHRSQYHKREKGLIPFTPGELDHLRVFLDAPFPWPYVDFADAYQYDLVRRTAPGGVARETVIGQRLGRYAVGHPDLATELLQEMAARGRTESLEWTDLDLDLLRAIAERHVHVAPDRGASAPPTGATIPSSASPAAAAHAGGQRRRAGRRGSRP